MFEWLFILGTLTLPINGARPFGLIGGISDLFYFAALGALVIEGLIKKWPLERILPWHPFWLAAGLIFVGGLVSTLVAANQRESIVATLRSTWVFSLWMTMGIVIVSQRRGEKRVLAALVTVALISAVVSVWDFFSGSQFGPTIAVIVGNAEPGTTLFAAAARGRFNGILGHPNSASQFVLVVIPIVLFAALYYWRQRARTISLVLLGVATTLIFANLLTGSVGGLVCFALIVVLGVSVLLLRRFARWGVPVALLLSGILISFLLLFSLRWDLAQTWSGGLLSDVNFRRALTNTGPDRLRLVTDAWISIGERPITGYGMDLVSGQSPQEDTIPGGAIHNGLLRAWLDGGILVFVGVTLAYLLALGLSLRAIWRYLGGGDDLFSLGLAISIIAWIVFDMAQPSFYQRFTWLTVALLYGLDLRYRHQIFQSVNWSEGSTSNSLAPSSPS